MSQRKAKPAERWSLSDAKPWQPKKEWVTMSDGRGVCVWQLSVPDTLRLSSYSQRHPNDPRPGPNEEEAAIWQIALSCRSGEESDAPRIFDDQNARRVLELDPDDFSKLLLTASRLMGLGQEAANGQESFTKAAAVGSSPSSSTGA